MTALGGTLHAVWLTGASCDGCSISVLGDTSVAPIEELLRGNVPGLPRIRLIHAVLSPEEGSAFIDLLHRTAAGEFEPYVLVVETSLPVSLTAGSFGWMGEEDERPLDFREWVIRLAGNAAAVIAVGDCAVFGGPHSGDESLNPTGATGVESVLGHSFRSKAGLPVVHLPGCSVPPVVIGTLVSLIRLLQGEGPPPDLDELGRPVAADME